MIEEDNRCPQCGSWSGLKYPRGLAPYCEDCGWPTEDFNVHKCQDRNYTVFSLLWALLFIPWHYRVILCAEKVYSQSPWTWTFRIEKDKRLKIVRINTKELT